MKVKAYNKLLKNLHKAEMKESYEVELDEETGTGTCYHKDEQCILPDNLFETWIDYQVWGKVSYGHEDGDYLQPSADWIEDSNVQVDLNIVYYQGEKQELTNNQKRTLEKYLESKITVE